MLVREANAAPADAETSTNLLTGLGEINLVVLLLVALLTGIVLSAGLYLMFRPRVERFFDSIFRSRIGKVLPDNIHRDSISDRIYGYYFWNEGDGKEWVSRLLRDLLQIDDYKNSLGSVLEALSEADRARMRQEVDALKSGKKREFELTVRAAHEQRKFECIGLFRDNAWDAKGITLWFRDITASERHKEEEHGRLESVQTALVEARRVIDEAPFPIWQRDSELRIVYCNEAYAKTVEATVKQVLENGSTELDKEVRRLAEKARDTRKRQMGQGPVVTGGKRTLYYLIEQPLKVVQGEEGKAQFAGYAIDASAQEAVEAELKRYIGAQSDLLESSASAMAIYGADMRLKSFNHAFVRLWKLEESWLDEQPAYSDVLEALREKRRLPEQANFPAFKKANLEMFTTLIHTYEEFYYLPDGKVLRVIVIPHALGGLLFAYEDVTDRLALERNYNTLIAVQRASLDHLHEGVAVFGEHGRLRLFNPVFAAMWGYSAEQLDGEPHVGELLERVKGLMPYKGQWTAYKEELISHVTGRENNTGRINRTDGRVLDWRSAPLPDGAVMMTYYDVTAATLVEQSLREKTNALEEADRVKTEFLASMSYELRSPLTSIMGFSEALSKQYFGELNVKQKEYIEAIIAASHKLMTLINDILDLASIEAGYMTLTLSRFDILAFLRSVLEMQEEHTRESGITIRIECQAGIGGMVADEARLKQVMYNLLHNAVKFSPPGSEIIIGARPVEKLEGEGLENGKLARNGKADRSEQSPGVALWVRDKGVGIAQQDQDLVFQNFHKAGSSRAHKSGTGLGLSMVKRFVELHGGQVKLESELGKGTCVTCLLLREVEEDMLPVVDAPVELRAGVQ